MPKKKFIDKKKSVTFHLVHRSQRDPLIHDEEVPSRVFIPVNKSKNKKIPVKEETFCEEFGKILHLDGNDEHQEKDSSVKNIRENTGEAILYGISYDDTEYDYMQHLREVGKTPNVILFQAPTSKKHDIVEGLPKEIFPSEVEEKRSYQDQQSVPDNITGFQPDMDPRLREVLEALEDDCYLSSDEEGYLDVLIKSGKVDDQNMIQSFDTDWDSDETIKNSKVAHRSRNNIDENDDFSSPQELFKYKRKNDRKLLSATTYCSMSSSALPRSEGLLLLDDRFEKIEKEYYDDDMDDEFCEEGTQKMYFESIMDDFLNNYEFVGKKIVRKVSPI